MLCPQDFSDAVCKFFVDNGLNDPNLIEDTSRIDLNDKNVTDAWSFQVNHLFQFDYPLTAKLYVDNSIDELSLVFKRLSKRHKEKILFKKENAK